MAAIIYPPAVEIFKLGSLLGSNQLGVQMTFLYQYGSTGPGGFTWDGTTLTFNEVDFNGNVLTGVFSGNAGAFPSEFEAQDLTNTAVKLWGINGSAWMNTGSTYHLAPSPVILSLGSFSPGDMVSWLFL